jgi:hypothetical protein
MPDHDDEGHHGPDDLDRHRLVEIGGLVRLWTLRCFQIGIEHHPEHRDEDHRADDQHHPVQPPGNDGVLDPGGDLASPD